MSERPTETASSPAVTSSALLGAVELEPQNERTTDEARSGAGGRWEHAFYNGYGNYDGFRFRDWCANCPHLIQTGYSWDCKHPDRAGEDKGYGVDCNLRQCPCIEIDGDDEEYAEWSDSDVPVLVLGGWGAERQANYEARESKSGAQAPNK